MFARKLDWERDATLNHGKRRWATAWTQMNPECNQNDTSDFFFIQWNGYIILYTVKNVCCTMQNVCLNFVYDLPCSLSRLDNYSNYLASIQKMSLQPEFSTLPSASWAESTC